MTNTPAPRSRKAILKDINAIHLYVRPGQSPPEGYTSTLMSVLIAEMLERAENPRNNSRNEVLLLGDLADSLRKLTALPQFVPAPREYIDTVKAAAPKVLALLKSITKQRLALIGKKALGEEEPNEQTEMLREQNLAAKQNLPILAALFTELGEAMEREQGRGGMGSPGG